MTIRRTAMLVLLLSGATTIADAQPAVSAGGARTAGEERAVNLCSTCHGPRGISTSPDFPILAAQREGYIVAQPEAFGVRRQVMHPVHELLRSGAVRQPPGDGLPRDVAVAASRPDRGVRTDSQARQLSDER